MGLISRVSSRTYSLIEKMSLLIEKLYKELIEYSNIISVIDDAHSKNKNEDDFISFTNYKSNLTNPEISALINALTKIDHLYSLKITHQSKFTNVVALSKFA